MYIIITCIIFVLLSGNNPITTKILAMQKPHDFVLRVMKATNSEYRFIHLSTGSAEIVPDSSGDTLYPFCVSFHTVYAPSLHVGARSLKAAYALIKESVCYVGYGPDGRPAKSKG